jgi:hypothetical protein
MTVEKNEQGTNYHDSVDHLRRDLMKAVTHWSKTAEDRFENAHRAGASTDEAVAYMASLMAGSYAYTLAAILGYARKYGEHVAHDLAFEADEILTNGDFDGLNKDVTEAPSASPS